MCCARLIGAQLVSATSSHCLGKRQKGFSGSTSSENEGETEKREETSAGDKTNADEISKVAENEAIYCRHLFPSQKPYRYLLKRIPIAIAAELKSWPLSIMNSLG
jgi:hypothetical protein